MVAEEYEQVGEAGKGPRPYFVDWLNPPVYDEGRSVDDPEKYRRPRSKEAMSPPEDDEDGSDETGGSQHVLGEGAAGAGPAIQAAVEGEIVEAGHADGADSPTDGLGKDG
ncbi:hypothetical protein J3459_011945 [Metarhizium acridum]|nr:hypothetical protein J3459_011945 [Metarhizium acridum]